MIKTTTVLEAKIGERTYQLECAPESPLGELHDALSMMKGFVIEKMKEADKASKPEEKPNG
jgi:hypothetical protein